MNGDLLKLAARNFEPLLNKKITIKLGRKGQKTILDILFSKDHFFHLAGLHKLSDIHFEHKKSSMVFDDILDNKIEFGLLESSSFYETEGIQSRLEILSNLYRGFSQPKLVVRKAKNFPIKGSRIKWSYLVEFYADDIRLGEFFIDEYRNGNSNEFIGVSIFEKSKKDYTVNQTKFTILSIYETDIVSGNIEVLFTRM
ncbi:PBECR4 domain-containing protein [Streptococcus sp. ZJ93]|uniref:PBECR4 domain-containing protein n=1 Tax=Streptococcus handemini TaxID=3161188 RepID=UPI0032EC06AC